jgi:hypothetical protein
MDGGGPLTAGKRNPVIDKWSYHVQGVIPTGAMGVIDRLAADRRADIIDSSLHVSLATGEVSMLLVLISVAIIIAG